MVLNNNSVLHDLILVLRYSIGTDQKCPVLPVEEWEALYALCKEHSLTSVVGTVLLHNDDIRLRAAEASSDEAWSDLLLSWMSDVRKVEQLNKTVTLHVSEVTESFEKRGFEVCLLKGQGNARMYPVPEARTPGDIDLWVRMGQRCGEHGEKSCLGREQGAGKRAESEDDEIRSIIGYVRKFSPDAKAVYHHIDCPPYKDTEVEIHYRPSYMQHWQHNKRIQCWFRAMADEQFAHRVPMGHGTVAVPTVGFNAVYQLNHVYQHLFNEGIGLRQIVDYFYLLTSEEMKQEKAHGRNDWEQLFSRFGLRHFAGAMMWILTKCLGMNLELALVAPDEHRGRFVLREIMAGGNFGAYDERYHMGTGQLGHNVQRIWRDLRLMRYFPSEALSEPVFRMYHAWWRWQHK